jgi:hypothetical protein
MKRVATGVLGLLMVACVTAAVLAQGNSRGTASLTLKGKVISVEYGRPSLRGRPTDFLLGRLKPGDVWRTGADTSTTFKTEAALTFGGATVPAGEYSLWMEREGDKSWKLIFNKEHGQSGTEHDASQDLMSVPLKESRIANPYEMVTIELKKAGDGGILVVQWGTLKATAKFQAT